MQSVVRSSLCLLSLLCLLFLLFNGNPPIAHGAFQQACLPTIQGQLTPPPATAKTLLINEVLLSSKKPWSCPGSTAVPAPGNTSWLELYNPQALSFNLYMAQAGVDGGPGTTPMYFPFGSAIGAHGFLTVFPEQSIFFHNAETFTIRLFFKNTIIDQVNIPSILQENQSYARIPDGASKWQITTTPTIGSSNLLPTPTPTTKHIAKSPTLTPKSRAASAKIKSTPTTIPSTHSDTPHSQPSNIANGVQPAWNQLQLPTPTSLPQIPSDTNTTSPVATTTNAPHPNTTPTDFIYPILLTGLFSICTGGLLLLWWRRRLKNP